MRPILGFLLVLVTLCLAGAVFALSLADLSNKDAVAGLKEALTQDAGKAVESLGRTDGFPGNPKVKIPSPPGVQKAEGMMRGLGMGKYADALETMMNRAAEAAVPEAKALVVNAVKKMSLEDVKGILQGGDDAATQYFRRTTAEPLGQKALDALYLMIAEEEKSIRLDPMDAAGKLARKVFSALQ